MVALNVQGFGLLTNGGMNVRSGICQKCTSEKVYYSDAKGLEHGITVDSSSPFVRLYKDTRWVPDIWLLQMAHYVCQSCGYFETYVLDVEQLSKLDECTNWRKLKSQ
jgi:hypothetical protein